MTRHMNDPIAPIAGITRRTPRALILSTLTMAVAAASLMLGAMPPASAAPAAQPAPGESLCIAVPASTSKPPDVLLGETVGVTLSVNAFCTSESTLRHIVLVLDGSSGMLGPGGTASTFREFQRVAAREFVRNMDLGANPHIRIGVVIYDGTAVIRCQLTNQTGRLNGCINQATASGEANIAGAIALGHRVLRDGRRGVPDPTLIREAMIVTASLPNAGGCPPLTTAADAAKADGIIIAVVCISDSCETACLRGIATSTSHFYEASTPSSLPPTFETLRRDLEPPRSGSPPHPPDRLVVVLPIPPNMQYVRDSAVPPPSDTGTAFDRLTWDTRTIPRGGITMTLSLLPLEIGCHPTIQGASGIVTDYLGRERAFVFEDRSVCVFVPAPIDTPVPTATPLPSATPLPTATPTVTPTSESRLFQLYFPSVLRSFTDSAETLFVADRGPARW